VAVGSSPHFTGFTGDANNAGGASGGGGTSYFVTAVTDRVIKVDDYYGSLSDESKTGVTLQIDHNDGAYSYYKDGKRVAYQTAMINPGKVDFAASNTTLSLMESYSKLIWRGPVNGSCETKAPFRGACNHRIGYGGCGYQYLPFGWNDRGYTRRVAGGPFDTPIPCSSAAGGPMPNPPVFNRYLDDVIVLTRPGSNSTTVAAVPRIVSASAANSSSVGTSMSAMSKPSDIPKSVTPVAVTGKPDPTPLSASISAPPGAVPAVSVVQSRDEFANYVTITFPGYAKFKMGDGMIAAGGMAGDSKQGVIGYWDLKNDPGARWDFGAADTGMFEHQWGINNTDGSLRYNEIKEGPMPIKIVESNNVRVKVVQSGPVRPYGLLTNAADCCLAMNKSYVFYRHGGGSSKVFTKTTLTYNGSDGKGPLTTAGTNTGINYYNKISWWKISGEVNNQTNQNGTCSGKSGLVPFTLSPWNMIYQSPGDYRNKDYILLAPVNQNSTAAAEFIPPNTCVSPAGSPQGPESTNPGQPKPGTIYLCDRPSNSGCTSQSPSSAIVKTNFLQIEREQRCNYMSLGLHAYFGGGLRILCGLQQSAIFHPDRPISWESVGFLGDNGITTTSTADLYATEYKVPPSLKFTSGSGGLFEAAEGYWTMTAASNAVKFSARGVLHSPAFLISEFTSSIPTTVSVDGVAKDLDKDFVAAKTDDSHLLLQLFDTVPAGRTIAIAGK
jgi:hypothetical protein